MNQVASGKDAAPAAAPPAPVVQKPLSCGAGEAPKESAVAAQSIRVNVDLLENLMTLVSELVLTRNQLLQMVRGRDDSEFAASAWMWCAPTSKRSAAPSN